MGVFTGLGWAFIIILVLSAFPALAQSETDESEVQERALSVDAPGVATVNQTIDVLVTSSEMPVSGAIVFFTTKYTQFQQITDENGVAMFTPEDTGRSYVFAHKDGYLDAEIVINVRDAPEMRVEMVAVSPTPEPTEEDVKPGLPGFGWVASIVMVSLVYFITRCKNS